MAIFSLSRRVCRRPQSLRQAQILILEILQCIPVVIIFVFPSGPEA